MPKLQIRIHGPVEDGTYQLATALVSPVEGPWSGLNIPATIDDAGGGLRVSFPERYAHFIDASVPRRRLARRLEGLIADVYRARPTEAARS